MRFLLPPLLAVALLAGACKGDTTVNVPAQGGDVSDGITVSGEGQVRSTPDLMTMSIGIEVEERTVAEARTAAADAATSLIDSLKSNGIAEKDIQTTSVSIYPRYTYPQNDQPRIIGYTAANQLTVKVRDLDRAGEVIDEAVGAAGEAARLQGISFGVDDPAPLLKEAREKAVSDAKSRAEAYARAAGVNVGAVLSISETTASYIPVSRDAGMAYADTEKVTPIEPGEATTSVNVTVRFAIDR